MHRSTASPVRALPLVLGLLLLLAAAAQAGPGGYADRPEPRDFRGLAFGAPVAELPGLSPVPGQADTFYRKDEDLTFGGARLVSVAYYVRKGLLTGVGMAVEGESNIFLVQDALIQAYGPGRQRGDQYGWVWPDFSLVLKRTSKNRAAVYYTLEREEH